MKKWIAVILCCFAFNAFAFDMHDHDNNKDKIGTFSFGPDDPFPWGREAQLPSDMGGVWEVREAEDGAYFVITNGANNTTGKPDINVHLFDPCTFELTAIGEGTVQNNALYSTLNYYDRKMQVALEFKAFYKSDAEKSDEIQIVLMVMEPGRAKKMYKYFPVNQISMPHVVTKCKTP